MFVQAENKLRMFEQVRKFHESLCISKFKSDPHITFFSHCCWVSQAYFSQNKIKLLLNENEAFQQMKRPEPEKTSWNSSEF